MSDTKLLLDELTASRGQFEKHTGRLHDYQKQATFPSLQAIHVGLAPFVGARFHEQPVRPIRRRLSPTA